MVTQEVDLEKKDADQKIVKNKYYFPKYSSQTEKKYCVEARRSYDYLFPFYFILCIEKQF